MTTDEPTHGLRRAQRMVRPRWVWGGLAAALSGAVILGIGVVVLSVPLSLTGTVLLLLGAACSVRGGVLYDAVPAFSPRQELRQVRDGTVHQGVAAGDMVGTDRARRDAVASNQLTRDLERAAHHPERAQWAPVAGWTCMLLTGMRVAVVAGRHRISAAVILVSGLGLALGGMLAEHDHFGLQMVEVISGCLAVTCALAAYLSPSSPT